MKTSWDSYLAKQLRQPAVKKAFDEELRFLKIGMALARQRKRKVSRKDRLPSTSARSQETHQA